ARGAAGMQMLFQDASRVLHGHLIARERHHLAAKRHMQPVERGTSEGVSVVARKHHRGPRGSRGGFPEKPVEAPSVAVPESIIPSAGATRASMPVGASFQMLSKPRGPFA